MKATSNLGASVVNGRVGEHTREDREQWSIRIMKLFVFKSSIKDGLHAFAGDEAGKQLPKQFQPWIGTGVVRADANPPHGLSRLAIERSIKDRGFQLWRSQKPQS
jgi:hypothetical protein